MLDSALPSSILLAPPRNRRHCDALSTDSHGRAGAARVSASVVTAIEKPSAVPEIMLQPIDDISGIVKLSGSKSLSNHILLLAALDERTTMLDNLLYSSDDVQYMFAALRALGLSVEDDSVTKRAVVISSGANSRREKDPRRRWRSNFSLVMLG